MGILSVSWSQLSILVVALLLVAAQVILVTKERCRLVRTVRAVLAHLRTAAPRLLRPWRQGAAPRSDVDGCVRKRLLSLRGTALQWWVWAVSLLVFCHLLLVINRILRDRIRWFTLGHDVLTSVLYLFLLVLQRRESLLMRSWSGEALLVVIAVIAALAFAPGFTHSETALVRVCVLLPTIDALSVLILQARHVAVCQAGLMAAIAVDFCRSGMDITVYVLPMLVGHWVIVLLAAASVEWGMERMLRAEMEVQAMQEKQLANHALLGTFYDVVIELDRDLRVTGGHEELRSFLPRPGRSLLGVGLEDLLPLEEERQLLRDRVARLPEGEDPRVDLMHLTMQDGDRDGIAVELFHFGFKGLSCHLRHLIGIREAAAPEPGIPGAIAEGHAEAAHASAVWVRVDVNYPPMPILECSTGFHLQLRQGPLERGAALGPMLHNERDRVSLFNWARRIVSMQVSQNFGEEQVRQENCVRVRLRLQSHRRLRILARCKVDFHQCSHEDLSAGHAVLCFSNLQRLYAVGQDDGDTLRRIRSRGTPVLLNREPIGRRPDTETIGRHFSL